MATERTTVKRKPDRGAYDRETIREILRAGRVCHVGFVADGGPVVIPTAYGVLDDELVVHGLPASRMLGVMRDRAPICATVTLIDALVLAPSMFDHSMNYRSVVVFGEARWIRDEPSKLAALKAVSEQVLPGRWDDARPPTDSELRQTHVLALPLTEASAKIRTGPPSAPTPDDEGWQVWTGVVPLIETMGTPEPDERARAEGAAVPAYVSNGRAQSLVP